MNIAGFIQELAERRIQLYLQNDRLYYRAASNALTDDLRSQIAEHRSALIAHLREAGRADAPYPLSVGQSALWFLYEFDRDSLAYNIAYAARLPHAVDPILLREAITAVETRHPVLRSRFASEAGTPVQRIAREAEPAFAVTDVSGWAYDAVERLVAELADQPLDLENGPVARWHLLTGVVNGAQPTPALLFVAHHSVIDFRSLEILSHDLARLYGSSAHATDLPPLPWRYRDYVSWSRDWLQSPAGRAARDYWLDRLSALPPVLEMPTDRPRPARQDYNGAQLTGLLPADLTQAVRDFSQAHLATPNMVLLSVFGLLLSRYSGQPDILIGSPTLGRVREELRYLVGYFVNTVVLRLRFPEDLDGIGMLSETRRTLLDALEHQDYPFALLVEALQPERDPSWSPLVQAVFVYEREHGQNGEAPPLFTEMMIDGQRGAAFDLTLTALDRGATIRLTWEYATALFDAETVSRLARHFVALTRALVTAPTSRIGDLTMLDPAEREQLRAWSGTTAPWPSECTVADLLAVQAARTPDAIAIEFGGENITYAAIDRAAGRLAHHLRANGVDRNVVVGIALPRGPRQIIAVVAAIRAGGVCLPLDPEDPVDRLAYILEESGAPIVVTERRLTSRLPGAARMLSLDEYDGQIGVSASPHPATPTDLLPADLLYVLYTSGSTGRPKGVAMPHRALVNLLAWQLAQPTLAPPARVLQYTPLTFDVAFQEILGTLCTGGTLVPIDAETRRDSRALLAALADYRIERLFLPFVALQHLAEAGVSGGPPPFLRDVVTAGEQLRITPAIRAFFAQASCRLHNHYGPTECHVVTAYQLPLSAADWQELPPIGRPIANVQVHLLDGTGRTTPIGVPGEVCIGGVALAQGYIGQPELTADQFRDHPDYGRVYHTGDLAKWRADGTLAYLGRRDGQIKLRGFRVELGEIEAVLNRHPAVSEAAVVVRGTGDQRRLVAYVVPTSPDAAGLRGSIEALLHNQLPAYMVPSELLVLDRLPSTSSGKVDRGSLPPAPRRNGSDFVAPRSATEKLLSEIWATVLERPQVGATSNFFELGGHSFLGMRLVAAIRDAFALDLPLRALFEHPTIDGLAALIDSKNGMAPLPAIARSIEAAEMPLSFGQQRLWLLAQFEGASAAYNMPAAFTLAGPLDTTVLRRALLRLVDRHASLRQYFPSEAGEPRPRLLHTYDPLSLVDLRVLSPDERQAEALRLRRVHAEQPFDLAHGPLFRLTLVRLDEELHWLLFNLHHIVADGWSLGVLMREIDALYRAERESADAGLPALPIEYGHYAHWQRTWLQTGVLAAQLEYWRGQLADAPSLLALPTDYSRPSRRTYRGRLWEQVLDKALTAEIRRFNLEHGSTSFMLLLAVLKLLLWRYSGQDDISIGTPVANRRHSETENLVGFFVNTLVLRSRIDEAVSFLRFLTALRNTCLDAYAHQDLPFDYLVDQLQPERNLSHSPLFQVMLVLQNARPEEFVLSGLRVEPLPPAQTFAKFDLTLYVEERPSDLLLRWEYNSHLFSPERIEGFGRHFEELLRSALCRPQVPVAALEMLANAERERMLAWGTGRDEALSWECLVLAFEVQVQQTPHRIAVRGPDCCPGSNGERPGSSLAAGCTGVLPR